ncbi:MAG: hypothetical protein ACOH18_03400 [Candidatus Saccharimonadaceae bacterium]
MDNRQFAEGYQAPANHSVLETQKAINPEVTRLMEGPRKWTSFFDAQLTNYLKDEPADAPEDIYHKLEVEYFAEWLEPHLYETVMDIRKLAFTDKDAQSAANELHFHVMNRELLTIWHHLLLSDHFKPLSTDEIYAIQVKLCIHAVEIAKAVKAATLHQNEQAGAFAMIGVFNGQLSEIDTAVTILEQMKHDITPQQSRLLLLPAPQKFEAGYRNRRRSIDFVLIDTEEKQARGVQVKTRIHSLLEISKKPKEPEEPEVSEKPKEQSDAAPLKRYDDEFVSLVDGNIDLGNTRFNPITRKVVSAPGLVSLNFLQHNVSIPKLRKHPVFRNNLRSLMVHQMAAKELAGKTKPYIKFASRDIIDRLMHDMYKEKSPE